MNSLLQTAITAAVQAGKAILDGFEFRNRTQSGSFSADYCRPGIQRDYPETVEKYALSGYQRRKQGHSLCYS